MTWPRAPRRKAPSRPVTVTSPSIWPSCRQSTPAPATRPRTGPSARATASRECSPTHHVYKTLAETPHSSISVVGWEPGQTSPIHSHPDADEIYHVLEGEGLFNDGTKEVRLGPGATVVFPAGEVHRVTSVTRMVLYRVQAGRDRHPEMVPTWPAR